MKIETQDSMRPARLIALFSLIALAGCFSLSRTEPPQRHYVLGGSVQQENAVPSANLAGLTIGVRRLRLASYLDPPFLVVRRGPHQVSYAEFHRWAEPLGGGINRSVAGYLVARAPFRTVDVVPWPPRERYDYVIQLNVERFEGLASEEPAAVEGEVHMLVTWEIIRHLDEVVLARGTTELRDEAWTVGDYASLVSLLDKGLNLLANDLIDGLASLRVEMSGIR